MQDEKVWEESPVVCEPIYKIDEKPPSWGESILYAWQHTLVDISPFVLPLAVASAMGMTQIQGAKFVNFCLFAMGISTLIQTTLGNRLPIIQGPSATHTAVLKTVGPICGASTMWLAIFLGGILEALLGALRVLGFLRKFFPIAVSGCVVMCIGISLGKVAMSWTFGNKDTIFLAGLVLCMILGLQVFAKNVLGGLIARAAIFISIWVVGLGIAGFFGLVDWDIVAQKPWFSLPEIYPYSFFEITSTDILFAAVVGVFAGYVGSILESIGDYAATCAACGETYKVKHMNRGITAEGFSCVLSSLLGAMPCTSYSQNIGIISTTRIASRFVVQIAACILILYGLCPKFGALLVAMPRCVLGAVFVIVCGMISVSGIRLLAAAKNTNENSLIIGITLISALSIPSAVQGWDLPIPLKILTGNTVVVAVVVGVTLNAVLNKNIQKIQETTNECIDENRKAIS
ncbi:uracil-xanthine permease family protein [Candidatus Uabimicrobium amorphum]|uniref:Xanthine permease n=1 Tax=Uabimicrobium amorphum TaxID=2596890 RepID=A0A5S9ITP1_UABAM|nr:solute carrier family 23 protein [Candidatus Uabimicrobium amorphum]BBM87436.1 xanthine permease [Candidatus Uabimicrobium amorphum]